jgi:hypothetical protein
LIAVPSSSVIVVGKAGAGVGLRVGMGVAVATAAADALDNNEGALAPVQAVMTRTIAASMAANGPRCAIRRARLAGLDDGNT